MIYLSIIIRNKEPNLKRCLDSVKNLVSKIYVADAGADKTTLKILSDYDVILNKIKWNKNYKDAREQSISFLPKNVWILILDSNQYIYSSSINELKALCNNNDALAILLRENDSDNDNLSFNYKWILFRNVENLKWSIYYDSNVKESILNIIKKNSFWKIYKSYENTVFNEEIISVIDNTQIINIMNKLKINEKNYLLYYKLGKLYIISNQYNEYEYGIYLLEETLLNTDDINLKYKIYLDLGNFCKSIENYYKALELDIFQDNDIKIKINIIDLYIYEKKYTKALELAKELIKKKTNNSKIWENLTIIYYKLNKINEAVISYKIFKSLD